MIRPVVHVALASALLAAGAGVAYVIITTAPGAPEQDLPGPVPVPVETVLLEPRTVSPGISGVGTLRPGREVLLASEIGGRVEFVLEGLAGGALVEADQVLLRTDVRQIELELEAQATSIRLAEVAERAAAADIEGAQAAVEISEERFALLLDEEERWSDLVARDRAEQARLDAVRGARLAAAAAREDARRALRTAEAALDRARAEIQLGRDRAALLRDRKERSSVVAPFTGRFAFHRASSPAAGSAAAGRRIPVAGDVLAPMAPFGTLIDTRSMRLVTEVHEDDVVMIRQGQTAVAAPSARPGSLLEGRVTGIDARVDPLTRSVVVESTFTGSPERPLDLPAGSFARVEITATPMPKALLIDERWIAYRDGRAVAFVVEGVGTEGGARASERPIEFRAGTFDGGRIVTSGLRPGDRVIITSLALIGDGARVTPVRPETR